MTAPAGLASTGWPRIALITPVFNSGKYIEQTIHSVLAQNYPNLDYFIVDGGSTDNTIEIIRKYEGSISGWISEPDNGMYDAINKGFARTTGDVMGWISATDQLHIGGLSLVGTIFGRDDQGRSLDALVALSLSARRLQPAHSAGVHVLAAYSVGESGRERGCGMALRERF